MLTQSVRQVFALRPNLCTRLEPASLCLPRKLQVAIATCRVDSVHRCKIASTLGMVTDTLCQVRATSWLRQGARIPAKAGENCLPAVPARGSLAVLIDGDNVSPTSLQSVLQATPQSYGCKLACK